MPKLEFEKLLIEAIDNGLSALGESPKQAIYFHLEKRFGLKKEEIPQNINPFILAVENIFGPGADFLKPLFLKNLCEKTGINPQDSFMRLNFQDSLNVIRQMMEER